MLQLPQFMYVCVVWWRTDRPCVWPCVCVAALPRRTWAAGVETSAGNTMVRWSWWVPPTMHSSVCCSLYVSAWPSPHPLSPHPARWLPSLSASLFCYCLPLFSVGMDGQQRADWWVMTYWVWSSNVLCQRGSQSLLHSQWCRTLLPAQPPKFICFVLTLLV